MAVVCLKLREVARFLPQFSDPPVIGDKVYDGANAATLPFA
jgi:hypothetical protein